MRRDVFDRIFGFSEGTIFLVNLADSLEANLLPRRALSDFCRALGTISSTAPDWWLKSIAVPVTADSPPVLSGRERFATVVAMRASDMPRLDPFGELVGEPLLPGQVVDDALAQTIFLSRESKKYYWVTDGSALPSARSADDVRDLLGLDWVSEEAALFELTLDTLRVAARLPRRPTGLCRGTPRFRALRDDESGHTRHADWGLTVDLARWRERAVTERGGRGDVSGMPELVVGMGPIDADCATPAYVGATLEPSGCTSHNDHRRFAEFLNGGAAVDADALYARLTEFFVVDAHED